MTAQITKEAWWYANFTRLTRSTWSSSVSMWPVTLSIFIRWNVSQNARLHTAVHNHVHTKIHTFDSARSVVNVHFATKRCRPQLRPCGGSPLCGGFQPAQMIWCVWDTVCYQTKKQGKSSKQPRLSEIKMLLFLEGSLSTWSDQKSTKYRQNKLALNVA